MIHKYLQYSIQRRVVVLSSILSLDLWVPASIVLELDQSNRAPFCSSWRFDRRALIQWEFEPEEVNWARSKSLWWFEVRGRSCCWHLSCATERCCRLRFLEILSCNDQNLWYVKQCRRFKMAAGLVFWDVALSFLARCSRQDIDTSHQNNEYQASIQVD